MSKGNRTRSRTPAQREAQRRWPPIVVPRRREPPMADDYLQPLPASGRKPGLSMRRARRS